MDVGDSENGSPLIRSIALLGRTVWRSILQQLSKSLLPYLFYPFPNISAMAQHVFRLANDMLFTTHDMIYHGTRLGRNQGSIMRYTQAFLTL